MNLRRWRLPLLTTLFLSAAFWGGLFLAAPGRASTSLTCPTVATTQYFTFVYGAVTWNSAAAQAGTLVEARSPRGDTVGCTVVESAGLYPLMYIFGEESVGGQTMPGMRTNEAVSFYVNGILATPNPAFTWVNSWQSTRVDLAVAASVTAPVAAFSASPRTGAAPLSVQFTDASTGTILARSWAFGDGATSTAQNPAHTYTTPGVYTVTLAVSGPESSNTVTRTNYITVTYPPPVAGFSASPTAGAVPLTVQFTDVSTGTIIARAWSFGDGATSSAQNPSHTYTAPGAYTVTLTVTGPDSSDAITKTNYIAVAQPPVAAFSAVPTSGTAPLEVDFTDLSGGAITGRSWSFGDGGSSTAQDPVHTYTSSGSYTVTLTVSGPGGSDVETKAQYIQVAVPPVVAADFSATPRVGRPPLAVQFTDVSTGSITSWVWSFGDGGTSTARHPAHQFTTEGNYTVALTVIGPNGADTETKANYVQVVKAPVAAFSASPTSGAPPLSVLFSDESTGVVTGWAWEFGDGDTSTVQSPAHQYAAAGTYTVRLTVTGPGGSNTATQSDLIQVSADSGPVSPTAQFVLTPTQGAAPLEVRFEDRSTGTVTSRQWNFGDSGTSTVQNPTHLFTEPGIFTTTLRVEGPAGQSTKKAQVRVLPATPQFAADPPVPGEMTVRFTFDPPADVTSWLWDFGDGQTSSEQNPTHTYATPGDYTVTLTVYAADGLSSSTEMAVVIDGSASPDSRLFLPAITR